MFSWKKLGRIFDPREVSDRPWMKEFAQGPCTLVFDDFVRVYFSCRPPRDENGQYVSYTGFVDLERDNLFNILRVSEEPILELGEKGTFDEFGTYPASVIRVGDAIYAYYGGWTRCESVPFNVAIGLAISRDDGVTFERYERGPILSYSSDEPFVVSGPKVRRFGDYFNLFYIAGRRWIASDGGPEPVYKIRTAWSRYGTDWKRIGRDIIESKLGEDEAQASPDVIAGDGCLHMFFCYRHGAGRDYRIGYAFSTTTPYFWTRDDSKAGIDVSESGWDSEMVAYPHVFELDDSFYMLYLGNEVGRYGFGLARLEGTL